MNIKSFSPQDLLKAKALAPILFVGIGLGKTYNDYKKAVPEKKNHLLVKDTVILTSSALGYIASFALVKHVPNIKFVDKAVSSLSKLFNRKKAPDDKTQHIVHKSLNHIETAIKECLKAGFITLGSIGAAIGGNELVSRYLFKKQNVNKLPTKNPSKPVTKVDKENVKSDTLKNDADGALGGKNAFEKFVVKTKSNDYIEYMGTEFSKDPANKVFASFSFLSVMRALDFPMTAVAGFDITKEKDTTERIKRTSYSLIANIFVPTFFVSIASAMAKNKKNSVKIPILAASTLSGIGAGMIIGHICEQKIDKSLHSK